MEPLLEEGEIVIIDRPDCDLKHLQKKNIYVVQKDSLYYVKHLHLSVPVLILGGNTVLSLSILKEDNPIIGKVVFSFRK